MTIPIAVFLFLHVMGAIIAFGPTFSFQIIGGMAGKEPQHANFAARITDRISNMRVEPLAVVQGITGLVLIYLTGFNPLTQLWLGAGIVLYLIAISYALFIQRPASKRIVELSGTPPPPGSPPGPPPELAAAIKKAQQGGMFLGIMIVLIVILMVTKPTI